MEQEKQPVEKTASSIQELCGLYQRGKFMGPQKWNEVTHSQVQTATSQFSVTIKSSGSLLNIEEAHVEFQVNLSAPTVNCIYHNDLQFLQGVNLRLGNHNFKYRDASSQLTTALCQEDYKCFKYHIGLADSSNIEIPSLPTKQYLSEFNAVPGQVFGIRIPLKVLFPEMCIKEAMKAVWIENESGLVLTFRVGQTNCLLHKTTGTAPDSTLSSISNLRIVYREAYPLPDQMSKIMMKNIIQNVPYYDVQQSTQTSGQFNFSLDEKESYRNIILCGVKTGDEESKALEDGLDNYEKILGSTDSTEEAKTGVKTNAACLPLEFDQIDINFPGKGKFTITRDNLMGLNVYNKAVTCPADRIFKWLVVLNLDELPFNHDLDESLVHGSEVQKPHQLTVNYKISTSAEGKASVPFYSGIGPADLGSTSVQCILQAEKQLVLKNGHYRTV